jgi:hypothetical protein
VGGALCTYIGILTSSLLPSPFFLPSPFSPFSSVSPVVTDPSINACADMDAAFAPPVLATVPVVKGNGAMVGPGGSMKEWYDPRVFEIYSV